MFLVNTVNRKSAVCNSYSYQCSLEGLIKNIAPCRIFLNKSYTEIYVFIFGGNFKRYLLAWKDNGVSSSELLVLDIAHSECLTTSLSVGDANNWCTLIVGIR